MPQDHEPAAIDMALTVAVLEPGYADYTTEREILGALGARVVSVPEADDDQLAATLARLGPVALLLRERRITAALLDACPSLKVVVRYGVGVDNIDLAAARARRIHVANVPTYGAEIEVSEHALALYLAVQRRLVTRDSEVREGAWFVGQAAFIPSREGAVLGLVGCGRIGQETARKFRAIGFQRVLVHDPYMPDAIVAQHGFERADLDNLFAESDVVSLHAPLTPETRHLVNADRLGRMRRDAILINVARGGLVDEDALADALRKGRIFGAGVDVFETEPPTRNNPLLDAPNAILTDHNAWYSERSVKALQGNAARLVAEVLTGHQPSSWVNRWD